MRKAKDSENKAIFAEHFFAAIIYLLIGYVEK